MRLLPLLLLAAARAQTPSPTADPTNTPTEYEAPVQVIDPSAMDKYAAERKPFRQ